MDEKIILSITNFYGEIQRHKSLECPSIFISLIDIHFRNNLADFITLSSSEKILSLDMSFFTTFKELCMDKRISEPSLHSIMRTRHGRVISSSQSLKNQINIEVIPRNETNTTSLFVREIALLR